MNQVKLKRLYGRLCDIERYTEVAPGETVEASLDLRPSAIALGVLGVTVSLLLTDLPARGAGRSRRYELATHSSLTSALTLADERLAGEVERRRRAYYARAEESAGESAARIG